MSAGYRHPDRPVPVGPDLPISGLRSFVAVVECRSYHGAAARCHRSQPAVTKAVQALEARLGAALFEPDRRTVLTPFGRRCEPILRDLLERHDRGRDALLGIVRGTAVPVRIASIGSFATNWLPELVEAWLRDAPTVHLRLFDDNSQNIERMVADDEVDFGLCSPVAGDARFAFTPLVDDDFGLVCRRDHPLAGRARLRWSEIAALPLIATTAHRQLEGHPEAALFASRRLHVSSMLTLTAMLEAGAGVTVLPRMAIPSIARELAFVPLVAPRRRRTIGILRLAARSLGPAAAELERRLLVKARRSSAPGSP